MSQPKSEGAGAGDVEREIADSLQRVQVSSSSSLFFFPPLSRTGVWYDKPTAALLDFIAAFPSPDAHALKAEMDQNSTKGELVRVFGRACACVLVYLCVSMFV